MGNGHRTGTVRHEPSETGTKTGTADATTSLEDGLGDWRIEAASTLANDLPAAYPGGPSHKAGAPIHMATQTRIRNDQRLGFVTPSAAALALNIAIRAADQAVEAKSQVAFSSVLGLEGPMPSVSVEHSAPLFDMFEHCMVAATFSYQALEAFCNHAINRHLEGSMMVKRGKVKELLKPDEIERTLSTEQKLKRVLPTILNVPSPARIKAWEGFISLRRVRDATVHRKSYDQIDSGRRGGEETFFSELLARDPLSFPSTAVSMILHFHAENDPPRWIAAVAARLRR